MTNTDRNGNDKDDATASEQALIDDVKRRAALHQVKEKQELLETWLASGGSAAEFDEAWPAIRAQLNKTRLQDVGETARRRSLSRFRRRP